MNIQALEGRAKSSGVWSRGQARLMGYIWAERARNRASPKRVTITIFLQTWFLAGRRIHCN